ncbi:MAG: hydrogenase/urease maturation nickel metallochaperone HypA [Acidimicrobiia bacterium]
MHENDLVEEALETLRSLTDREALTAVEMVLGPGVDRARAIRAWRALTEGTPFESVHVTWEQGLDLLRCGECGHEYTGDGLESCPYCGADGMVVEAAVPIEIGHWSPRAPDLARAP